MNRHRDYAACQLLYLLSHAVSINTWPCLQTWLSALDGSRRRSPRHEPKGPWPMNRHWPINDNQWKASVHPYSWPWPDPAYIWALLLGLIGRLSCELCSALMPWYFPIKWSAISTRIPTDLSVVTCWKMSIEVILKAAEYIERRERGKRRRFAVFHPRLVSRTSVVIVSCVKGFYTCTVVCLLCRSGTRLCNDPTVLRWKCFIAS